jgi:hypothetical protein
MGSVLGHISEEVPNHDVLGSTQCYEVRKYHKCVVAESKYQSKDENAMRDGKENGNAFMRLAGFIGVLKTPQNADKAPIAMTAPVFMSHENTGAANGRIMQFVLPGSRFSEASEVPAPTGDVTVKDVPERIMAVKIFSGSMNDDHVLKRANELKAEVERDGLQLKPGNTTPMLAGYNPPWTPSFLRTNEVLFELDSYKDAAVPSSKT